MEIKKAKESDIEQITKLLYQVHKIHSDKRPDLFIPKKKKYNENELKSIIKMKKNRFLLQQMKKAVIYLDMHFVFSKAKRRFNAAHKNALY